MKWVEFSEKLVGALPDYCELPLYSGGSNLKSMMCCTLCGFVLTFVFSFIVT